MKVGIQLKKLVDFLSRGTMTGVGAGFLALSLAFHFFGISVTVDPAWVTVFISGVPLIYLAFWRLIFNRGIKRISSALLIVMAMFAAIAIGDLFAAGEVAFIMAIGAILEEKTANRAKRGLKNLISLAPVQGRKVTEAGEVMVAAAEIAVGDIIRVLPGESIAVDGEIVAGETSVDQSIITGESLPVDKGVGDEVFCGTINRFGAMDIRATKVGEDGSLQKLIRMVENAEANQAPIQRIADKCAGWLVPVALGIAIAAYFGTGDIVVAVTVLVVFCPCALVLATPTAVMAAIGQATNHGVVIKSGEALEKMGKVDTIAFDKTGTLTTGNLTVREILPLGEDIDEAAVLAGAAAAEAKSEHPLARAIVAYADEKKIHYPPCGNFKMEPGKGVTAEVEGATLYCGNQHFLEEQGIVLGAAALAGLDKFRTWGMASVVLGRDGVCLGIIAVADTIKDEAAAMVGRLKAMNTKTVLLTGDNQKAGDYLGAQAGITAVYGDLLPEEKVGSIQKLQNNSAVVCMIGDGVNDAPALKIADVGVAMGTMGSDIAVEAADIALMGDDIGKIPYLKRLSNAAVRTIKLSITLSMCINFVAIILSLMKVLTPTTGALVHNAGSCVVVLIAALLYERKFD